MQVIHPSRSWNNGCACVEKQRSSISTERETHTKKTMVRLGGRRAKSSPTMAELWIVVNEHRISSYYECMNQNDKAETWNTNQSSESQRWSSKLRFNFSRTPISDQMKENTKQTITKYNAEVELSKKTNIDLHQDSALFVSGSIAKPSYPINNWSNIERWIRKQQPTKKHAHIPL